MPAERIQSEQEKTIRRYFYKPQSPSYKNAITAIIVGGLLSLFGIGLGSDIGGIIACFVPGVIVGSIGVFLVVIKTLTYQANIKKGLLKPSDKKIDTWFEEGMSKLVEQSFGKLGLDKGEIIAEPLAIKGPIIWSTNGVNSDDLVWHKGDDGIVRFGVYRITIIQLTNRHLAGFACDYNFIKNVSLNERTDEYHYKDVVSVSTQEQASSYTLPTGIKLTTAQEFRLSVASGESIRVTIGAAEIAQITGSDKMPETGAEKAVNVIRAMLREKKE